MGSDGHQRGIEGVDLGCGLRRVRVIVERYVSNVFYSERIVRVFYSQSDKILGVFYPK